MFIRCVFRGFYFVWKCLPQNNYKCDQMIYHFHFQNNNSVQQQKNNFMKLYNDHFNNVMRLARS